MLFINYSGSRFWIQGYVVVSNINQSVGLYSITIRAEDNFGGMAFQSFYLKIEDLDPVNGACGSANGGSYISMPNSNLCSSGSPSSVIKSGSRWTWTCSGVNGGSDSDICDAEKIVIKSSFDGDFDSDILWRDSVSGRTLYWQMTGGHYTAYVNLANAVGLNWVIQNN